MVTVIQIREHMLDLCCQFRVVLDNCVQEHPGESPELTQTVHLMEECDAVYHAIGSFFTRLKWVIFPV